MFIKKIFDFIIPKNNNKDDKQLENKLNEISYKIKQQTEEERYNSFPYLEDILVDNIDMFLKGE